MAAFEWDGIEEDDDLTQDVASLRAVLSENAPFPSPDLAAESDQERTDSERSGVFELQICLDKNRALQHLLVDKLRELDVAITDNEQKQRELESTERTRKLLKRGLHTLFRAGKHSEYFKDNKGKTPSQLDVCTPSLDPLGAAVQLAGTSWHQGRRKKMDDLLTEGVRSQIIDTLLQLFRTRLEKISDQSERTKLRREMQELRKTTMELIKHDVAIDWSVLAYEKNSHTPKDCELRWRGHAHPALNKGSWTKQEDKRLITLARNHDYCNWALIATELGTNRSAFSCLGRFQQSLNPNMFNRVFTRQDDERLLDAVKIFGDSRWSYVSAYMEGKTPSQCLQRWMNTLKPGIKRGRWTKKEDELLRDAVEKSGVGNWTGIAHLVPGRTQSQVRERWVNHLDRSVSKEQWTPEEDKKLLDICSQYTSGTIPWSAVAKEMTNRTDGMCLQRWHAISDAPTIIKRFSGACKQRDTVMTTHLSRKRSRHTLREDDIEDIVTEATKQKLKNYEAMITELKSKKNVVKTPRERKRGKKSGAPKQLSTGASIPELSVTGPGDVSIIVPGPLPLSCITTEVPWSSAATLNTGSTTVTSSSGPSAASSDAGHSAAGSSHSIAELSHSVATLGTGASVTLTSDSSTTTSSSDPHVLTIDASPTIVTPSAETLGMGPSVSTSSSHHTTILSSDSSAAISGTRTSATPLGVSPASTLGAGLSAGTSCSAATPATSTVDAGPPSVILISVSSTETLSSGLSGTGLRFSSAATSSSPSALTSSLGPIIFPRGRFVVISSSVTSSVATVVNTSAPTTASCSILASNSNSAITCVRAGSLSSTLPLHVPPPPQVTKPSRLPSAANPVPAYHPSVSSTLSSSILNPLAPVGLPPQSLRGACTISLPNPDPNLPPFPTAIIRHRLPCSEGGMPSQVVQPLDVSVLLTNLIRSRAQSLQSLYQQRIVEPSVTSLTNSTPNPLPLSSRYPPPPFLSMSSQLQSTANQISNSIGSAQFQGSSTLEDEGTQQPFLPPTSSQ